MARPLLRRSNTSHIDDATSEGADSRTFGLVDLPAVRASVRQREVLVSAAAEASRMAFSGMGSTQAKSGYQVPMPRVRGRT